MSDYKDTFEDLDAAYRDFDFQTLSDEYLNKTKKLFNEKVKDYVESLKTEKEKTTKLENEYYELINTYRSAAESLEKQKQDFEKHKNDVIYEMLSKFGLDLKPKQKVYVIGDNIEFHDCPHCKKGKLEKIIDGVQYHADCPYCEGRGYSVTHNYKIASGIVSDMVVNLYWNAKTENLNERDYYDTSASRIYLNNLTPYDVFSENLRSFRRKDIYLTEEDAQKEIDRRMNEGNY